MSTTAIVASVVFGVLMVHSAFQVLREWLRLRRPAAVGAEVVAKEVSEAAAEVIADASPVREAKFVAREIEAGLGTLLVRERSKARMVSGQLIVWSSEKKKRGKVKRIQDGFYDLGLIPAEHIDESIVDEFLTLAINQMRELAGKPPIVRPAAAVATGKAKGEQPAADAIATAEVDAQSSAVSIEDNEKPDAAIKLKKFPSVFRGKILEVGHMPRAIRDEEIMSFGVKYRTPEGVEDIVWGVNLKTALHTAKATVGDEVEILKIGRKTVEKGKAPMNLYKITKL